VNTPAAGLPSTSKVIPRHVRRGAFAGQLADPLQGLAQGGVIDEELGQGTEPFHLGN
jgi:hypothetical protein